MKMHYWSLLLIFAAAAFARFFGLDWDSGHYLHPDERFLGMVAAALKPVSSVSAYFDTLHSTLNPHNVGFHFFVYGTLPVLLVRGIAAIFDRQAYHQIYLIGRMVSATCDLGTLMFVYLIARKTYNQRIALTAAAFFGLSVLPIQIAHFFTVDAMATFFSTAAIYFLIVLQDETLSATKNSLAFACGAGLAIAAKISAVPLVGLLVIALYLRVDISFRKRFAILFGSLALTLLVFRVAQPYAFLEGLSLNPKWLANLAELKRLMRPTVGFPPSTQWIDRPRYFALENLFQFGLGIPLGIAALFGLLAMVFQLSRRREIASMLFLVWSLGIFLWQGVISPVTSMRYLVPIYPILAIVAAWGIFQLPKTKSWDWARTGQAIVGGGTAMWAIAFLAIYTKPVTRLTASQWIFHHVSAPINLNLVSDRKIISLDKNNRIDADRKLTTHFSLEKSDALREVEMGRILGTQFNANELELSVIDGTNATVIAKSHGIKSGTAASADFYSPPVFKFLSPLSLSAGTNYTLEVSYHGPGSLKLASEAIATETPWDDALPLSTTKNPVSDELYDRSNNLDVYSPDTPGKAQRMVRALADSDVLVISSNRQWGSLGRLPDRFPLMQTFYRNLLDCPEGQSVLRCFRQAEQPQVSAKIGYRLVQVFTSYPSFLGIQIPDQTAEEAFTVYDHPKVFIFRKTRSFNEREVEKLLLASLGSPKT